MAIAEHGFHGRRKSMAFRTELILDMPEDEYHSDPCEEPGLSYSTAKLMMGTSPAHAAAQHPKLGEYRPRSTKEMDFGSVVHAMLLGGVGRIEVIDASSFRTKAAQEARDAALELGRIPMLNREFLRANELAQLVREKLRRRGIEPDEWRTEASLFWKRDTHHGPIQCRSRIDATTLGEPPVIYDLKVTSSPVPPKDMGKHIWFSGYAIQAAANTEGALVLRGEHAVFKNIFVEDEPPYAVTVVRQSEGMLALGRQAWDKACDLWGRCCSAGSWPEYDDGEGEIVAAPPDYVVRAAMEEAMR
jgi:hypothetical protein